MIRMFLSAKAGHAATGRRQKTDHATVEEAKAAFSRNPNRHQLEALIYVDGAAAWIGESDGTGAVKWRPWTV